MSADTNADEYGSIDHVLPVSKGGTHTWNNVRLAHRGCNMAKRDRTVYEKRGGQMALYV
jgi:5-methylcytosine-specific restriction endonuclease McrA